MSGNPTDRESVVRYFESCRRNLTTNYNGDLQRSSIIDAHGTASNHGFLLRSVHGC
jgi:hypothetical protein